MAATDDLYEVLQVSPSASSEVIEAAYRRLARIHHPDVNSSPNSNEMMRRLNHAYQTLSDSKERLAYDWARSSPVQQQGRSGGPGQSKPSKSPLFAPITVALLVVFFAAVALTQGYVPIPSFGSGSDPLPMGLAVASPTPETLVASPTPTATVEPLETLEPTATPVPPASPTPEPTPAEATEVTPREQIAQLLASMAPGDTAAIEVSVEDAVLETELQNAIRQQGGTITSVNLNLAQTSHIIRFTK